MIRAPTPSIASSATVRTTAKGEPELLLCDPAVDATLSMILGAVVVVVGTGRNAVGCRVSVRPGFGCARLGFVGAGSAALVVGVLPAGRVVVAAFGSPPVEVGADPRRAGVGVGAWPLTGGPFGRVVAGGRVAVVVVRGGGLIVVVGDSVTIAASGGMPGLARLPNANAMIVPGAGCELNTPTVLYVQVASVACAT